MDPAALPLVERKRKAARQRIVAAAAELFAARGFDGVSVSDIAERAEVGRTTFFRHFGDKQEVVFSREQDLLDALTEGNLDDVASRGRALRDGLLALRPLVLRLCAHITDDPEEYRQHEQLVESNVELRARSAVKMQLIAGRLGQLLVDQGWAAPVANLAAQIALACYWTARASGDAPEELVDSTAAAFRQVLAL